MKKKRVFKRKMVNLNCFSCRKAMSIRAADVTRRMGEILCLSCSKTGEKNPNFKGKSLTAYECKLRAKKKNPERFEAMDVLHASLRKGDLKRLPCEICGNLKSEGHHEDYSKPLEVEWLCRTHHVERHTCNKIVKMFFLLLTTFKIRL